MGDRHSCILCGGKYKTVYSGIAMVKGLFNVAIIDNKSQSFILLPRLFSYTPIHTCCVCVIANEKFSKKMEVHYVCQSIICRELPVRVNGVAKLKAPHL